MTDDELHVAWIAGQSIYAIARHARTTPATIAGRVRRLRRKEGLERWPYHPFTLKPRRDASPDPPKRIRSGTSTLPPLASLEGHGETSSG
jgi:hypothetical protein